ncbi:hypothetical protein GCM10028814_17900 [Angustibacter aerolatus]
MQPSGRRLHLQQPVEAPEGRQHELAAPAVDAAGPPHVAGQQPVVQEARERRLRRGRPVPVAELARRHERVVQPGRREHKPGAQRRQHRLRERADVHHPAGAVGGVQRFEGARGEAELAVVVVLDHGHLPLGGPPQQGRATPGRQHRAERELVRRRDVHQAGGARQQVDPQALVVDRHRHDVGAELPQQVAGGRVPRVLHGDDVAR